MNLNISPYYDDFDKSKKYTKILALPGRTAQAREFTQIQTITRDMLARLGNAFFKNGVVIQGGFVTVNTSTPNKFVHISESQVYFDGLINEVDAVDIPITGIGYEKIGLYKQELIIDEINDPTLKDPALSYDNFEEAGAHRLQETVIWTKITPDLMDMNPIEIYALMDGKLIVVPTLSADLDLSSKDTFNFNNLGSKIIDGLNFTLEEKDDFFNYLTISPGEVQLLGQKIVRDQSYRCLIPISRHKKLYEKETITVSELAEYYEFKRQPVAEIDNVKIVVKQSNKVFRDAVLNSGDPISPNPDDKILAIKKVTQDGFIFEPFNGTNHKTFSYRLVNDRIVWEGSGPEPLPNSLYSIDYEVERPLTKQIVEKAEVLLEEHNILTNNVLANDLIVHNDIVPLFVTRVNSSVIGEDDIYRYDKDFTIDYASKEIVWDNYYFFKQDIVRGVNLKDTLTLDINKNYKIDILNVGGFYDSQSNVFVEGNNIHPSEYELIKENGSYKIQFSNSNLVTANTIYSIIVRQIVPKSSHRPITKYYVSYAYWKEVVFGDYRSVDSYYFKWSDDPSKREKCLVDFPYKQYLDFRLTNGYKPELNSVISYDYKVYIDNCVSIYLRRDGDIVLVPGNPSMAAEPDIYAPEVCNALYLGHVVCYANSKDMDCIQSTNRRVKYSKIQELNERIETLESKISNSEIDLPFETLDIPNKTSLYVEPFRDYRKVDLNYRYKTINSRYAIDYYNSAMTIPGSYTVQKLDVNPDNTTAHMYESKIEATGEGFTLKAGLPEQNSVMSKLIQTYFTGDETTLPKENISLEVLDRSQFYHIEVNPKIIQFPYPKNIYKNTSFDKKDIFKGSILNGIQNINFYFTKSLLNRDMQSIDSAMGIDNSILNNNQLSDFLYSYCPEGYEVQFRIPLMPFDDRLEWRVFFGGLSVNVNASGDLLWGTSTKDTNIIKPARINESNYGKFKGSFVIPSGIPAGVIPLMAISNPIEVNGVNVIYKCLTYINCADYVPEDEYGKLIETLQYVEDNAINISNELVQSILKENSTTWYNQDSFSKLMMEKPPFNDYSVNFWDSRRVTLNGTLCQTFQPLIDDRYLKSMTVEFSSKNKNSGVFCKVVNVKDGYPITESTGLKHNVSYISSENINVNSSISDDNKTVFKFNPPCYINGSKSHGFVFYSDYKLNLSAVNEAMDYGDIRLRLGTLGKPDLKTNEVTISNPYRFGDLYKSQIGVTWEKYEDTDLKFELDFYTFDNSKVRYIYWNPLKVENINSFYFLCSYEKHPNTNIVFQYRYANSDWIEFEANNFTRLEEITSELEFRAVLSSNNDKVSPFIYIQDVSVAGFTPYRIATYITKEVQLNNESNTVDMYFNAALPDNCKFRVFYEVGNSGTFNQFSNGNVPWLEYLDNAFNASIVDEPKFVKALDNYSEYRYHYIVSLPSLFKSFRIMLVLDYFYESNLMPYISNLMIISSREISYSYFTRVYKGSGSFSGEEGTVITLPENLPNNNYTVNIIPTSESENIGEYYVSDKLTNSFVVKNSGNDTTATFDWLIVY